MAGAGAFLVMTAALASAGPAAAAPAPAARTKSTAPRYAAPGPYAAGVTTLDLPDRKVEVWYPAKPAATAGKAPDVTDLLPKVPPNIVALLPAGAEVTFQTDAYRDVPAARKKGGFPLVLATHGTAGYREEPAYLATHLASWGFVVVSPDILERGLASALGSPPATPRPDSLAVMRDAVALVRAENLRAGAPLAGRVKKDKLAVMGQAAGGTDAIRFGSEPGIVAVIPISASGIDPTTGGFLAFPNVPALFVTGTADTVVPVANVQAGFQRASFPSRFVGIDGMGHANLAGICPIGGPGGLVGLAQQANLPVPDVLKGLTSDGCSTPAPNPDPSWPVVRHAVTAQLRNAFGIDKRPVGLDAATMAKFAPVTVQYQERLP